MDQDYKEIVFRNAVSAWWDSKERNSQKIKLSQGGTRDGSLAGDTMDGFHKVIVDYLVNIGVDENDIFYGSHLSDKCANLPSHFRASKNWDIVVCKNSRFKGNSEPPTLIAAIEFKSQHKSVGNNQNNRIEESIGSAFDFWMTYESGGFGHSKPRPWLGYLFVGMYEEKDFALKVKIKQPHIECDDIFKSSEDLFHSEISHFGPSYAYRYKIFMERMVANKLYNGAAFITTNQTINASEENYACLFPELSGEAFLNSLSAHIRASY